MSTRLLSEEAWISEHASGTLRFAAQLGTSYRNLYLEERVHFTFGGAFEALPMSRILTGPLMAESDCRPFTEGVWQCRRRRAEGFAGDVYSSPLWIQATPSEGPVREGLGLILTNPAQCAWLPSHLVVFAFVAPAKNGQYTGEVLCL